ncbi:MAG: hypothetical protein ACXIUO_08640 [Erythrobacter sp.]
MLQIIKDAASFRADKAWGARDLAMMDGATIRLHWTDQPYQWHRNDGREVFVVLQGEFDMYYRIDGAELQQTSSFRPTLRQWLRRSTSFDREACLEKRGR